ncbi:acylphosphatase [Rodentibacter caecimuris]|uniref:Acylphosphatase n=1 Tax=Rodentibacter caecimuris TaxID=1796644 RepID=A0A9X8YZ16_9PAST|nr:MULTISPECIES: acylphosphatase [Pasteurellaceae]AOF54208.1 Acylphosphate phosphohydrolase, putative [Pasteurellaceae bacterium NI1060]MCQ9122950.1 acylphosphatase [Rodentibacter heylii]MCR1836794.1 acylphosphatase [Pasteurella caecimuris]MCU0105991.1 acylphosphatase [Pasteurella caecimuris]MCX2961526.1 acylphosphatase [Rodentibacter heylii]
MTKQFFIYGRVQGVGFRYFTWKEAKKLGIKGFVRNRDDGSVEAIAQGSEEQLESFEQWLRLGPVTANVERVIVNAHKEISDEDFSVIRD